MKRFGLLAVLPLVWLGAAQAANAGFDITHRECAKLMAHTYETMSVIDLQYMSIQAGIVGAERHPSEQRASLSKSIGIKKQQAADALQDFMEELRPYCQSLRR